MGRRDDKVNQFALPHGATGRLAGWLMAVFNADTERAELSEQFNDDQIVQIVAVISLFGYLNRWNDTMATTLEAEPLAFARQHLTPRGWRAGKHERSRPAQDN